MWSRLFGERGELFNHVCEGVILQILIYPCVTFLNTGIPGYKFNISDFEMAEEQKEIINGLIRIGRPSNENDDSVQMGDNYIAAGRPRTTPM